MMIDDWPDVDESPKEDERRRGRCQGKMSVLQTQVLGRQVPGEKKVKKCTANNRVDRAKARTSNRQDERSRSRAEDQGGRSPGREVAWTLSIVARDEL